MTVARTMRVLTLGDLQIPRMEEAPAKQVQDILLSKSALISHKLLKVMNTIEWNFYFCIVFVIVQKHFSHRVILNVLLSFSSAELSFDLVMNQLMNQKIVQERSE